MKLLDLGKKNSNKRPRAAGLCATRPLYNSTGAARTPYNTRRPVMSSVPHREHSHPSPPPSSHPSPHPDPHPSAHPTPKNPA